MRDILAGGDFQPASAGTLVLRIGRKLPRRQDSARSRRSKRAAAFTIAVQPGQLASPLLKSGFPSLLMH